MSLRKRLTIIAAASVAIAVLLALIACYAVVRSQLRGSVDNSLRAQAQAVENGQLRACARRRWPGSRRAPVARPSTRRSMPALRERPRIGEHRAAGQQADAEGRCGAPGQLSRRLPGRGQPPARDHVPGPVQSPTAGRETVAVQLARPLNGVDSVLSNLRVILLLLFVGWDRPGRTDGPDGLPACTAPARRGRRGRPAHRGDRGPALPPARSRRRRGWPAGDPLQRDARPPGELARRPR